MRERSGPETAHGEGKSEEQKKTGKQLGVEINACKRQLFDNQIYFRFLQVMGKVMWSARIAFLAEVYDMPLIPHHRNRATTL